VPILPAKEEEKLIKMSAKEKQQQLAIGCELVWSAHSFIEDFFLEIGRPNLWKNWREKLYTISSQKSLPAGK